MNNAKKFIAAVLSLSMLASAPAVLAADDDFATRGKVASMLLAAADDYNPEVEKTDIIKGYEDGQLHEENNVTRAEALVMLKRAFGELPEPTGHNACVALPMESFTDIPEWAQAELEDVFDAGIVAGTSEGIFSPNENVTEHQMELFIRRVFALFGTNPKDDFYAAVNKETLETLEIQPGQSTAGTLNTLGLESDDEVEAIINELLENAPYEDGSKEQKIVDYYNTAADIEARNEAGIEPVKKYLDAADEVQSVDELIALQNTMTEELTFAPFLGFTITMDLADSTRYMVYLSTASPALPKTTYISGTDAQKQSFIDYAKELFVLGGETEEDAQAMAQQCYDFNAALAEDMLNIEDSSNVDLIYNIYTLDEIKELFPTVDIDAVYEVSGLEPDDEILVSDVGLAKALGAYMTEENLDTLKAWSKFVVLTNCGSMLNEEFTEAGEKFNQEFAGVQGGRTNEELAMLATQSGMADYIGELYAEKYFSEEAKLDVENMVNDIIAVYRERLQNLDWMSGETKAKAVEKLDAMGIKIGYPDDWETPVDNAEILSAEDGGSYFSNSMAISKAASDYILSLQNEPVDKTAWGAYPFTVNAFYSPQTNDITFPAAILQPPMYDVDASYEENLGGIGYVIAHEITHAFDNNGAKFDKDGNAADWWTEADYDAFEELCGQMVEFYDGWEAVPGVPVNGTLTLSENIADQGAVSCITEIASSLENPDYKALYESIARCWATTASREYYIYASQVDVHSPDKLRANRTIVSCDEFYEAFDIDESDAMYVAPENRVHIW